MSQFFGTSNKKLELSIVIPVYNVEKYIGECIDSILKIKNINYEVLIVNDGSPDNSQKIIDEYCKKDNRIKSFIKKNGGVSSARNYGLERAEGEYIWFVDGDDFIDGNNIEKFFNTIQLGVDIVIGSYFNMKLNERKNEVKEIFYKNTILSKEDFFTKKGEAMIKNGFVWKNLYRRLFLKENKMLFLEGIVMEDQLFNIFSFIKASKLQYINIPIYYYREGRENSLSFDKKNKELFVKSGYEILLNLLKINELKKFYTIKKIMLNYYLEYVKFFKKRDYDMEKQLWTLKGIFFIKLEKRYKIWRIFKKMGRKK